MAELTHPGAGWATTCDHDVEHGVLQWRIVHGVIAVYLHSASSHRPRVLFYLQTETVFHAFMRCSRLKPFYLLADCYFSRFNKRFSVHCSSFSFFPVQSCGFLLSKQSPKERPAGAQKIQRDFFLIKCREQTAEDHRVELNVYWILYVSKAPTSLRSLFLIRSCLLLIFHWQRGATG